MATPGLTNSVSTPAMQRSRANSSSGVRAAATQSPGLRASSALGARAGGSASRSSRRVDAAPPVTFGSRPGARRIASSAWAGATDGQSKAALHPEALTRTNIQNVVEAKDETRQSAAQLTESLQRNITALLEKERKVYDEAVFQLKQVRAGVEQRELTLRDLLVQHRAMGLDPEKFLDNMAGDDSDEDSGDHSPTKTAGGSDGDKGGGADGFWGTFLDRLSDAPGGTAGLSSRTRSVHGERASAKQTSSTHSGLSASATLPEKRAFAQDLQVKLLRQQSAITDVKVREGTIRHILDRLGLESMDLQRHLHLLEDAFVEEKSRHDVLLKTRLAAEAALGQAQGHLKQHQEETQRVKGVWQAEIAQQRAFASQKNSFVNFLGSVLSKQEHNKDTVGDTLRETLQARPGPTAQNVQPDAPMAGAAPAARGLAPLPRARPSAAHLQPASPADTSKIFERDASYTLQGGRRLQSPPLSAAKSARRGSLRLAATPQPLPVEIPRSLPLETAFVGALRSMGLLRVLEADAGAAALTAQGGAIPGGGGGSPSRRNQPPPVVYVQTSDGASQRVMYIPSQAGVAAGSGKGGSRGALPRGGASRAAGGGGSTEDPATTSLLHAPPVLDAAAILSSVMAQDEVRRGLLRRRRAEEARIATLGDQLVDLERAVSSLSLTSGPRATNKVLMDKQGAISQAHREGEQLASQLAFINSYVQAVQQGLARLGERLLGLPAPPSVATPEDIEAVSDALVSRMSLLIQETRRNFAMSGENPNALAVPLRQSLDDDALPKEGRSMRASEESKHGAVPPSMLLDMQLAENLYLSPHNLRVGHPPMGRSGGGGSAMPGSARGPSAPPAQTDYLVRHAPVPRPLQAAAGMDSAAASASQPDGLGPLRPLVRRGVPASAVPDTVEGDDDDDAVLDRTALKRMAGTLLSSAKYRKGSGPSKGVEGGAPGSRQGARPTSSAAPGGGAVGTERVSRSSLSSTRDGASGAVRPDTSAAAKRPIASREAAAPPPTATGSRYGGMASLDDGDSLML